jgi:hypothetical protein
MKLRYKVIIYRLLSLLLLLLYLVKKPTIIITKTIIKFEIKNKLKG